MSAPSTAAAAGLLACEECGRLSPAGAARTRCPRCSAALHARRPDSLARTTALLLAATLLYLPANLLPMLVVTRAGRSEASTLAGGIRALFAEGQPVVATLVLFASLVVPSLKIAGLAWMVACVRWRSRWRLRDRAVLFRFIDFVGRWSMLDIFMISILVALVRLSLLARIEAGPGALPFAAVVVLTLLAARTFDPRLMWDVVEEGP